MLRKMICCALIVSSLMSVSTGPFTAPSSQAQRTAIFSAQGLSTRQMIPQIWRGTFELPVNGAAGYASVASMVYSSSGGTFTLVPGEAFMILAEEGRNLRIRFPDGREGLTDSTYIMINLPDVLPSIVYNNTSADAAIYRSLGKTIVGVTNAKMYNSWYWNARLGKDEYTMPILYAAAKKIAKVQRAALANGETLVIYETYRPYDTQMRIVEALDTLRHADPEVNHAITDAPWTAGWFVARQVSLHQRGCALDVSLAKVTEKQAGQCGDFLYIDVTGYEEYQMQTPMHELSNRSIAHAYPVTTLDKEAWKTATLAPTMTADAIRLRRYFTDNGFCPLSSEWWHFNDLDAVEATDGNPGDGSFFLTEPVNWKPEIFWINQ